MAFLFKKYRNKGIKKKRMPSQYKRSIDLLDKVFSYYVRLRDQRKYGKCPICLIRKIEVNFHFFPRKNMATRYEADACCGSCRGCNYQEHMRRGIVDSDAYFRATHVRLVGEERVKELESQKGKPWKKSAAEVMELVRYFEAKLATMK